jgi:thiol-disulfide isomerase/thioredoxin
MIFRTLFIALLSITVLACSKSENTPSNTEWQFINYWAIWCKPCIEEIPEFNELATELKGKAQVFAVNFDGIKGQQLQNQAQKIGIAFTVLEQDPAQTMGHPIPSVLPSTYVYSPEGKLHKTLIGPQTLESLKAAMQ